MKNIYFKIITSAIIPACLALSTCGFEETDDYGMVWIPPTGPDGFWMGSSPTNNSGDHNYVPLAALGGYPFPPEEQPVHQVTLTKGFYMGRFLITQRQYYAIMKEMPSEYSSGDLAIGGNRPVEGVSWYNVIVFCNRLSIREGLSPVYRMTNGFADNSTDPDEWIESSPGRIIPEGSNNADWNKVEMIGWPDNVPNGYRLPTESEWEYACRAGRTTPWNTGDSISQSQANFGRQPDESEGTTTPVGSYVSNAWGLYDMHGNVWEWCWDWMDDYNISTPPNPKGPVDPSSHPYRVVRGGNWNDGASDMRSAFRSCFYPYRGSSYYGFRVVRQ